MKIRQGLETLVALVMLFAVALTSQQALGAGQSGLDAPSETKQNAKQEANKQQEESRARTTALARAQLELLELQKKHLQEQVNELTEQLEEEASEQIKQLKEQTEEQIKQAKQRVARQIKQWKLQAQWTHENLEAQQRVLLAQAGIQAGEMKRVEPPNRGATGFFRSTPLSEVRPLEIQQAKARLAPAAFPSLEEKLDRILERLDEFEKRLDRLEKQR
jgi:hypothetical protein